MGSYYILRFDDITDGMAWSKFLPIKKELELLNIKSVLGVVPNNRDPKLSVEPRKQDFFDRVRGFRNFGDAILQHGTHHLYTTHDSGLLGINKRSEFAGLPLETQFNLLAQGKATLVHEDVWEPYFMAPAHSFDNFTLEALRRQNFKAISDGYGFRPYKINGVILVPQLVSRPFPWFGGIQTICVHVNNYSLSQAATLINFARKNRDNFLDFKKIVDGRLSARLSPSKLLTELILKAKRQMQD